MGPQPRCAPQPVSAGSQQCPSLPAYVDSRAPQSPASAGPHCFGGGVTSNLIPSFRFPPQFVLPGMIVTQGYPPTDTLRIRLESYIITKFCPVPGGFVDCLWMYENYQRTMMYLQQRVVISPFVFVALVPEICERNWGVRLGRSESIYGPMHSRFLGIMPILYKNKDIELELKKVQTSIENPQ